MNGLFSENSPLVIGIKKFVDLVLINLLWLICSLPLITIGISTAAFYDVVYKDIWHSRGTAMLDYFSSLRSNARQGFPAGLLFVALAVLLGVDIWMLRRLRAAGSVWGTFWVLLLIFLCCLVIYFIWVCAYIARFRAPLRVILLNTLKLSITHFPVALLTGVLTGACILCIWLWPGMLFFLPVLAMLGCCLLLNRVFRLYMTEEERQTEDERNHSWRLYRKGK